MPQRNDLVVLALFLICPAGHRLGRLHIDADTATLRMIPTQGISGHRIDAGQQEPGTPLHYEAGRLRYRCPKCVTAARSGNVPWPQPRAVPWRTVASLAAALACRPTGNLNRTLPATRAVLDDYRRAILPPDQPKPDGYQHLFDAWQGGPSA